MPKVAFFSINSSSEVQKKWEIRLKQFYPSIKLVPLFSKEAYNACCALLWKAPMNRVNELDNLKGLISLGQGVDHILNNNDVSQKMPIVRIIDSYMAKSMSHWVLISILNILRNTYYYYEQEKIKLYKQIQEKDFSNISIGIYGIGEIGSVVAQDLNIMGFKVNGWSRTQKKIAGVNCLSGSVGFTKILTQSDVHVCILPLTKDTQSIFNKKTFSDMKRGCYFINAGRGEHVVEEDLLNYCKSNHISNAILDVYRIEPLPKEHPFWEQENIRLWPHVAAETNLDTASKQIANAIKCIENNIIPPNTIDRLKGY